MTKEATAAAVQVALRIRPLTERDRAQPRFANLSNDDVLKIHEKTVHVVPHNKLFTFDYVFGTDSRQSEVFEALGAKLINKFTEGYNVTILAYGQTSSGKTYTMGTAQHQPGRYNMEQEGIVPRAMALLFDTLTAGGSCLGSDRPVTPAPSLSSSTDNTTGTRLRPPSRASHHARSSQQQQPNNNSSNRKYSVKVSFVEIYNEELIDLLNAAPANERLPVNIREDAKGHIYWTGVKEVSVNNTDDVLFYLEQGTRNRATGSTDMNEKSSRSHAIFSVSLRQEKWASRAGKGSRDGEWMVTTSKFHFVDLAGSERLKRTAAEGERRKEGININAGLLALGNVISALGDPSKRSTHIPYRDSKLTRLLQDSLGGSATTLMIACASPVEYNLSETLNTLQYANRARNIKNRVEKNEVEEWMTSENIELLRSMIGRLKSEVRHLKAGSVSSAGSTALADPNGHPAIGAGADADQVFQEQRLVIADFQRQVEELDGEASVTRERNRVVEAELKRLRKLEAVRKKDSELRQQNKTNYDFQHLVEPVIEEYEKSIAALESQLAMARAALNHSDIGFEEQRQKLEQCELMLENQDQTVIDLRSRLNKLQERESNNEAYIDELEGKLVQSTKDARRDQELLNELKTRIMRFKETDENTEQYIFDLEQRLATSEAERHTVLETVEELEKRLADRDATIDQLRHQLAKAEDTDTQKMMLQEIDDLELKYTTLEKERDQLKAEIDQASQKEKQQQHEQPRQASTPPPPSSPLPKPTEDDQQERDEAASRRYANEQETRESKSALAAKHAEERLAVETAKVAKLSQDLVELQSAHHELQEVHDELLKENDEVLMRYQEVTDQLALLNRPDHSMDALSKEMSRAKEEAETKEREDRLGQIKELETKLAEAEAKEADLAQELKEVVARQRELLQDLGAAKNALDANQVELEDTRARLADLQALHAAELDQSRAEGGMVQTMLDETLAELDRCKKQLTDIQAELDRHVGSRAEEVERHRGLLESSDRQMTLLQQKLADTQADNLDKQQLGQERDALQDKVASVEKMLAEALAELENDDEIAETKAVLARQRQQLSELQECLSATQAELEQSVADSSQAAIQQQLARAQEEVARYKEAADDQQQRLAELEKSTATTQQDVEQELERYKAMATDLQQRLDVAATETQAELLRTRARVKELEALQEQQQPERSAEGRGDIQDHRVALELKDKAIADLQQDLDILEEALAQAEERQKKAEQEHLSLLDDVTLENDQLAGRIKELERAHDSDQSAQQILKDRIEELERTHEADQSTQQAFEDRIKQLENEVQKQGIVRPPSPKADPRQQQSKQEYQEHVDALQEELDLAQATNTEKEGHLRMLRSQVEAHARTIAELEEQIKKAEFTSRVGASTEDGISKLYEDRMGALEQKTKALEEENKEYQTLSEELEAEVSRLIRKEDQYGKASEAAAAAAVAATERRMTAEFQAAKSQAETRISALEAQLLALEQAQQDAGGQTAGAQAKLADTEAKLADAERRAQAELAAERKAREQAERTLASLESQLEEMINKKSKFMCF